MTHRSWRVYAVLSLAATLVPLDVASQTLGDSASALVDLILTGDDSQEAWSSLVEALGVGAAPPPFPTDLSASVEPPPSDGVGDAAGVSTGEGAVAQDETLLAAELPVVSPRSRAGARGAPASVNARRAPASVAGQTAGPPSRLGQFGIALLAASCLLIVLVLRGRKGSVSGGARARRRRSFTSRDAARLEARLRSRGAA